MTAAMSQPRIVVGVDGSPASVAALRWAAHLAQPENAVLDAVIAWETAPVLIGPMPTLPADYAPDLDAEKALTAAVEEVFGNSRPAGLRLIVREGRPAQVLLQLGRDARLVVVGSRGRGAIAGALLGSVSTRVAGHATCPVLVVPADAAKA